MSPYPALRCVHARAGVQVEELLTKCEGSAEKLASLLKLKELKEECAKRDLKVSGTKQQLAPRLLDALRAELAASPAYAAVPPLPTRQQPPPPPSPSSLQPSPSPPPLHAQSPTSRNAAAAPPARRAAQTPVQMPAAAAASTAAADGGVAAGAGAADSPLVMPCYDASGALIDSGAPADAKLGSGADLELHILGSGACNPSPWRGASCAALRVRDSYWLFDVGEGTQVQLQKSSVRPSKIDKIFITHAHGDHCFGLPGLLCLIARGRDKGAKPLEIYGPEGLRSFVRATLSFTGTRMLPPYVVHELHGVPNLRRGRGGSYDAPSAPAAAASGGGAYGSWGGSGPGGEWGEVAGGSNLLPNTDGSWWSVLHETEAMDPKNTRGGGGGSIRVTAAPVHHTVPTVGYVIVEDDKEGRLQVEKVMPLLERNRVAIREEMGFRDPRKLLGVIKGLGAHGTLDLPDGSVIRGSDVLGETRRGRKVAVLGDCCDASLLAEQARGADLLVHEATNAFLPQFGDKGSAAALERETARHGHSTPQMAGRFGRRIDARAIILTHFSQRYHPANRGVMSAIAGMCAAEAQLPTDCVASAYDGLMVPLWQPDRNKPALPEDAFAPPSPQQQQQGAPPLAPLAAGTA